MSEEGKRQYRVRPRTYIANGPYIQQLREEAGLTLEELAEKAQLSGGQVSRIERGESPSPRPSSLDRIAAVFGLTRHDISLKRPEEVPEIGTSSPENISKLEQRKRELDELDGVDRRERDPDNGDSL